MKFVGNRYLALESISSPHLEKSSTVISLEALSAWCSWRSGLRDKLRDGLSSIHNFDGLTGFD